MWCAHQIINYVHCNLILAGAVPSNVIQPRKCLVQSNLIKSRMNILITSVSACSPLFSLVAKSHSFLQFLGENQVAARLPPIIFHPALFAPRTSFLHSRENSFWICGESGTSPIWYSAYSQRNGPGLWWAKLCLCVCMLVCLYACVLVVEAVLVALTTIYDTWRLPSSHAEDKMFLCYQQRFLCYKFCLQYTIKKYNNLHYLSSDVEYM